MTSIDVLAHRQNFPALPHHAYFNYGGQGPIAQASLDAIFKAYETLQALGPFSHAAQTWIHQLVEQTREALATELGISPKTLTLTENVSGGCNIVLWGMDWQAGDHLVISDCEHPGIVAVVAEVQRRFQLEVSICPLGKTLNGGNPVDIIRESLTPNTRLLVLSHVLWNTGQLLPLPEIVAACREHYVTACRGDADAQADRPIRKHPLRLLVDGAQTVGMLPLNLAELGVDFYAFTGHKWCCGPEGVGGLYVRPEVLEELHPTFVAWRGILMDGQGNPTGWKADGQRFEVATSAYPLYAGLKVAIATHQVWGSATQRYQRIQTLSHYLWQQLAQIPDVHCLKAELPETGLVSFQVRDHAAIAVVNFLEEQGILVRTILNPDCIRACVHYFTLESEIDRLLKGIQSYLKLV